MESLEFVLPQPCLSLAVAYTYKGLILRLRNWHFLGIEVQCCLSCLHFAADYISR